MKFVVEVLIEMKLNMSNLNQAFGRHIRNKGAAGVDAKDVGNRRLIRLDC
ncbi:hypothetical protein [Bacillus sp. B1-b2]|nr:hypothetical protein [Bacillus sp. B1-b2]